MDEAFIKKVQPNSPEAEQSVIGAMIMDRDAIADVIDIVRSEERRVGKECRSRWSPYH